MTRMDLAEQVIDALCTTPFVCVCGHPVTGYANRVKGRFYFMSSDNKATEVLYALRGISPPLDAAGVLITEGAWVIRAITMGQTASLIFARAFPAPEPASGARHPTPATHVNVTTYGVSTDVKSYRRAVMQRGVVQHAYRMLVINEEQVPAVIRAALSGPEDELKARYKARTKIAVGE